MESEDCTNPQDPSQAVGWDWANTLVNLRLTRLQVVNELNSEPHSPTEAELSGVLATPFLPDIKVIHWISESSHFHPHYIQSTHVTQKNGTYCGCYYSLCKVYMVR